VAVHEKRMEGSHRPYSQLELHNHTQERHQPAGITTARGGTVQDVLYIGLIIVVFAALWLLVKGVERFER
jgi:hypothetical protein